MPSPRRTSLVREHVPPLSCIMRRAGDLCGRRTCTSRRLWQPAGAPVRACEHEIHPGGPCHENRAALHWGTLAWAAAHLGNRDSRPGSERQRQRRAEHDGAPTLCVQEAAEQAADATAEAEVRTAEQPLR